MNARERVYAAALEEAREEAALCRAGNRMVMVKTIENIIRRTRAALAAADAVTDALVATPPACSVCGIGHPMCVACHGDPVPAPMTAERRAELVEVMRSTQVSVRERMGKVLDALIKAGAVK